MKLINDHGTKLLGGLTTAVGVLGSIDPTVLAGLLGERGLSYVTAITGVLTILRGIQNSKNVPPPAP